MRTVIAAEPAGNVPAVVMWSVDCVFASSVLSVQVTEAPEPPVNVAEVPGDASTALTVSGPGQRDLTPCRCGCPERRRSKRVTSTSKGRAGNGGIGGADGDAAERAVGARHVAALAARNDCGEKGRGENDAD